MILASIISFLDTMDSSDYLSIVVDILVYFSEHYQNIFGQRFNVRTCRRWILARGEKRGTDRHGIGYYRLAGGMEYGP